MLRNTSTPPTAAMTGHGDRSRTNSRTTMRNTSHAPSTTARWVHDKSEVELQLTKASGLDLQWQRPANTLLDLLEFDNEADANNFRMMCTYCHQVGTLGFRSPEEPVDWEVMLTRMDGFQGWNGEQWGFPNISSAQDWDAPARRPITFDDDGDHAGEVSPGGGA